MIEGSAAFRRMDDRPLAVLVVGADSSRRARLAERLMGNGHRVFLCSATACPLERGGQCPLLAVASLTLGVQPGGSAEVRERVARCLRSSEWALALDDLGEDLPTLLVRREGCDSDG